MEKSDNNSYNNNSNNNNSNNNNIEDLENLSKNNPLE